MNEWAVEKRGDANYFSGWLISGTVIAGIKFEYSLRKGKGLCGRRRRRRRRKKVE